MKKIFILAGSLFLLPLTAGAASVTIMNQTTSGGGTIVDGSGEFSATANHNDITASFSDTWKVDIDPAGSIFSLATSNFFSDFKVEYSLDDVTFFDYDGVAASEGILSIKDLYLDTLSAFTLRISGSLNGGFASGGYNVSVSNSLAPITVDVIPEVPVPAAVWLFGSVMVGLAGFKPRRTTGTETA